MLCFDWLTLLRAINRIVGFLAVHACSIHSSCIFILFQVCSNPLISFLSFRAGYPCTSMLTGLHLVWQLRTLILACLSLFKVL
ncbi:hypothetical protein HanPSC8_Chr17g0785041 [Helianthus annuus]|nr:hypothetical protein HanPSC8_Chr17g0785041 [Helianthus annuus]